MKALSGNDRARWAIAAIVAVVATVGVVLLFRFPPPPSTTATATSDAGRRKSGVQMAKSATGDAVLAEELVLRDMRPLFLPVDRINAAVPEPRREPGRSFFDNETLKLGYPESDLNIMGGLPRVVVLNGKAVTEAGAVDVLAADAGGGALHGFGRTPAALAPVEPRGGYLEVVAAATGGRMFALPLPREARPPGNPPWEPMELLASVDPAGLTAPLVVTNSSRVEEVDTHFRTYLAKDYRIGDRLPPGFYRIVVGP